MHGNVVPIDIVAVPFGGTLAQKSGNSGNNTFALTTL